MNTIPNGGPPVPKKARLSEPAASNTNNFAFNTKHDNSTLKSLLSGSHSNGMTEGATKKSQKKHSKKKNPLHSGRWTPEEEAYVEGMIAEFTAGLLPIAEGTTLRSFLAKMLNCNPKRVSKKYDGNKIYNGKSAFSRARTPLPPALACERQEHLLELERKFREALSTMQRVESRLQSLTATGAYAAGTKRPPVVESLPSNSAVSSLTASGDEAEGGATATAATSTASKSEQCSFQVGTVPPSGETSVAQVSQCMDAPSLEALKEPEPAAGNSYDDAAMLLQLRTPTVSTANASAITQLSSSNQPQQDANSRDTSFNGDLILQDLHKSQARDEAAAASAPKQNNAGGDATTLQHILQSLQQPQQVTPAAPANNSDLLALAGMFAQQQPKSSSPIQAPKATQNSLQDLLLSLQKNNGFSGTANGASITENLLKQLSSTKSVNQEQQKQMPPPLDFQSALMALQQQQQQQQPMVSPKTDIERLVEQIMNSNSNGRPQQTHSQQAPTSVSLAPNSADTLSSSFQQIAQSVPKHATAPSAAATWQTNSWDDVIQALTHLCRQGQADTNHFPVHQSPQQQQQASLENVMSSVINQMQTSQQQQQQYMVQPQQQQQQPQGLGAPALQSLMQSIGASVQQQQEAPKPSTVEETLQKWLVSIQQQH